MKCEKCGRYFPNKMYFAANTNICGECFEKYGMMDELFMAKIKGDTLPEDTLGIFNCEIKNIPLSISEKIFLEKPTESLRQAKVLISKNFLEISCSGLYDKNISVMKVLNENINKIIFAKVPEFISYKPGIMQGFLVGGIIGALLAIWFKEIGLIIGIILGIIMMTLFHKSMSSMKQLLSFELVDGNNMSFVVDNSQIPELKNIFNQINIEFETNNDNDSTYKCSECGIEVELDEKERSSRNFICPKCNTPNVF